MDFKVLKWNLMKNIYKNDLILNRYSEFVKNFIKLFFKFD